MTNFQTSSQGHSVGKYSKNQLKLSSIAYLTTGLGLLTTFLVALGFAVVFENATTEVRDNLSIVATFSLLLSLILSIVWQFRVMKAGMGFRLFTILIYCLANGIGFGSLFAVIDNTEIVAAFGITAAVCAICYFVSRFLTEKAAMTLSKLIMVMFGVYFVIAITTFFSWTLGVQGGFTGNVLEIGIAVLVPMILLLAITFQMWNISRMDQFINDSEQSMAYGMFLGFMLLMMIIQITWQILRIISYFK